MSRAALSDMLFHITSRTVSRHKRLGGRHHNRRYLSAVHQQVYMAEHTRLQPSCVHEQQSYGVATFVQCPTKWRDIASSTLAEEGEWVTTEVEGVNITNVYNPHGTRLFLDSIPRYQQPCIYAGDFNCHRTTWGNSSTNTDGTTLEHWASNTDVTLLYDPKQPRSFRSARWGTSTNPDLCFANLGTCASRRVLERFPKSQHRPSIIESSTTINSVPTRSVNRWNFRKADWAKFTDRLNTAANKLPSPTSDPNTAYKAWCSAILSAAKKTIPRGAARA